MKFSHRSARAGEVYRARDTRLGRDVAMTLFETHVKSTGQLGISSRDNYAVSRDGQRFLINELTEVLGAPPITVVLDWTADLKK